MTKTFEALIGMASTNLEQAEQADFEDSTVYSNLASGYALIAIAQELHRMNERKANEIEQRLDLSEARVERLANLAG